MWTIKGTRLLADGFLPRDSIWGQSFRSVFFDAKPEIDYAFKVDRPPYIFVWWFDEYVGQTLDLRFMSRPELGKFYTLDLLNSGGQQDVGRYIESLGFQVRWALMSIERLEYVVLVIFSAEGAILQESAEKYIKVLEYQEPPSWLQLDDLTVGPERRELVCNEGVGL